MVDTKTVEILAKAKGFVEEGWCQNSYDTGDRVCAIGALERAAEVKDMRFRGKDALTHPLYAVLMRAKKTLYPEDREPFIQWWNDEARRKKEQVVCLFQKAIELVIEESE